MSGITMEEKMKEEISQFMGGMKQVVASAKAASGESLDEGKKAMTFDVYKKLCQILYRGVGADYLFAHTFLTLEWNLLARSDNCLSMNLSHIEWRNDSLLFYFGKSKSDQEGDRSGHPWHVYSNPNEPELCPVLALSKYLLSNPSLLLKNNEGGGGKLFPGNYQYDRFMKIFHKVIYDNKETFRALGVEEKSLGSHSCRKGAITLCSSGCTVSPPMAAICLRACWSMGPVKDRYIHYEKAGDQFCGRTAIAISSLTKEFAVSPAYWDFTSSSTTQDHNQDGVDRIIAANLVCQEEVSPQTFGLLRFLFAAICHNYTHLDENLHGSHGLRSSALFIAAGRGGNDLRQFVVIKYPWNQTDATPFFTGGIPPHVIMMAEIESLTSKLEVQRDEIIKSLSDEWDKRGVGKEAFEANTILGEVMNMHNEMMTHLSTIGRRGGVQLSGVAEVRPGDIWGGEGGHEDINFFDNEVDDGINDDPYFNIQTANEDNDNEIEADTPPVPRGGIMISWGNMQNGKICMLPTSFKFPKMSFPNFLTMWFCGDRSKNVPPLRIL